MFRAKLFHQFGNAPQLALLTVFVEGFIQPIGQFLGFDLKQNAIEQRKMLGIHALDFFVQHGLQLFRLDVQRLCHNLRQNNYHFPTQLAT
jgi:hypothetical protein